MSTLKSDPTLQQSLSSIPKDFRDKIIDTYLEIKKRFSEAIYDSSYDAAGLSSGKFCEVVLRFLQYELTGNFIPFGSQVSNFFEEATKLSQVPKSIALKSGIPSNSGIESLRITIPRALNYIYTIRNKRGIGHVGGDVEANGIDSASIARVADWVVCELIRIYYGLSLEEAQDIVDSLATKNNPLIWEVNGRKRVLDPALETKKKVLLLAYTDTQSGILAEDLFKWSEYSNYSVFKSKVLKVLHAKKLIEYDQKNGLVFLSPTGISEVEENILRKLIVPYAKK
jgi:hypothetical protein